MRRRFLFSMTLLLATFAVRSAEEVKAPQIVVIKDEKAFQAHFKGQVLGKQMSPQILSKKSETLEQTLALITAEARVIQRFRYMTEYDGWLLFTDAQTAGNSEEPTALFDRGYAIKKGTNKLVVFGFCW